MAWTYTSPTASDKDAVRFLVGDTDTNDQLVTDEEIEFVLADEPNPYKAAADVADAIASKFARTISMSADGLTYNGSQLFSHYTQLSAKLRSLARRSGGSPKPYAGGIYASDRVKDDNNDNLIPTHFRSHMHDAPGTASGHGTSGGHDDELRPKQ